MDARSRTLVTLALLLAVWTRPATPQLPVYDGAVFAQMLLEVARSIELVNLAIRDLAPLTALADAMAVAADLERVMSAVQGIAAQMQSRSGLWSSLGPLPETTAGLAALRAYTSQLCRTTVEQGLQGQSLLAQAPVLLSRLTRLLASLQTMLGAVAGLQSANAMMADVAGHLVLLQSLFASANEPQLCKVWEENVRRQSIDQVTRALARDYGTLGMP